MPAAHSNRSARMLFALPLTGLLLAAGAALATTWDEPWHETVVKEAQTFLKARIVSCDGKSCAAETLVHLAGDKVPEKFTVDGFYLIDLTSTSSIAEGPRLRFQPGAEYYLFLKKAKDRETWTIATPSAGFATLKDGQVLGTYRHSYHQAYVAPELYEKTQVAIFEFLHGRAFDKEFVRKVFDDNLKPAPAELGSEGKDPEAPARFFRQHVALECFCYFGEDKDLPLLEPFLKAGFFHVQISAARALGRIDTKEARRRLVDFIREPGRNPFAKVMAVWGLKRLGAKEFATDLEKYAAESPDEKSGFGGDIMDPRIGTRFPSSVKAAIEELLAHWRKAEEGKK